MPRSFRLKIALFSALLAGVALAGFAALALWQIRAEKVARIDGEIHSLVQREVAAPHTAEAWARLESASRWIFGATGSADTLLLAAERDGGVLFRSSTWPEQVDANRLPWPPAGAATLPGRAGAQQPRPAQAGAPGRETNAVLPAPVVITSVAGYRVGVASSGESRLALAVNLGVIDAEMAAVRTAFLLAAPLALALIGTGAWFLSNRALKPIQGLTETIRAVSSKGLDQRIALDQGDREFEALIRVFNAMLERLERSFTQASRFSADAAHELKTPLAILQGQIERAIQEAEDGSTAQARFTGILDEVRRLSGISSKLLLLSQSDAGRLRLHTTPFDLSAALADLAEDARMLGPALAVSTEIEPGLRVAADAGLLTQVLHNLISNAIKFNVAGGWVRISAAGTPTRIEVVVANASAAIPEPARPRLFERFYRADPAHGRAVEGVGLGLSVSREIARAHGGDLELRDSPAGEVRFAFYLPAA